MRSLLILGFTTLAAPAFAGAARLDAADAGFGDRIQEPAPAVPLVPGAPPPPAPRPDDGKAPPRGADPEFDARARAIASQLRCAVCLGLSVQDSPTELAREMKQVVRDQLAAGRTSDEIKAYFVDRYGEWVLLQPEPRGFNLVVYLFPIFGLLAGGGVIVVALRRWTRPPEADQP